MKVNINDLFQNSTLNNKQNVKFTRIWNNLKWRQSYQNSDEYKIELANNQILTVKQILNGEIKGFGTGTLVWPAAHVLVKYLEKRFSQGEQLTGMNVCDLGSGTGITGFGAALLGANVVVTDQEQLISFLEENKQLICSRNNGNLAEKIQIKKYDWGDKFESNVEFDYVLVSDCVLPKLYPIEILIQVCHTLVGS